VCQILPALQTKVAFMLEYFCCPQTAISAAANWDFDNADVVLYRHFFLEVFYMTFR
jgi:hypothetical protein